ncbi:MAG TPA: helix-turn-helix domain-containing protein [Capsulimonadaceae bacterium]|jgi:AraC-like DNA-binding protein
MELDRDFPILVVPYNQVERGFEELHIHDRVFEIGICHSGEGVYEIEQKVYSFRAGDVYCINHAEYHNAFCPSRRDSHWDILFIDFPKLLAGVSIDSHLLDTNQYSGPGFNNRFPSGESPELHRLVQAIVDELTTKAPYHQDAVRSLAHRLLVELARERPKHGPGIASRPNRTFAEFQAIKPALDLIATAYGEPITIQQLADVCCLSETHFRRQFTSVMERTPLDYLAEYRVSIACSELKYSAKSISQISFECGFGALSSFNRQFAARRGCTPGEWRASAVAEPSAR